MVRESEPKLLERFRLLQPMQPSAARRLDFALLRSEVEARGLREENERLRKELLRYRSDSVRNALAREKEREDRLRTETAWYSGYRDFVAWFGSADFPMTCVGSDGVIDQANERQLRLLGYSRHEYVGRPIADFLRDGEILAALDQALAGREVFQDRHASLRCKDGTTKPVMVSTAPFDLGPTHGICCYMHDLSEIAQNRAEREKSDELFRQLNEHLRGVFWIATPEDRRMLYVSPAYETVWGCSRQRLYEDPASFLDRIHKDDRERVRNALDHQAREGAYHEEYRIVRPDGTVRWVLDRAFPVCDDRGQVYRLAGLAEDITDIKEAEGELRKRAEQQEALAELGQTALTEMSLQKLFDDAVERLEKTLDVELTEILELDLKENRLLWRAGRGWPPGVADQPRPLDRDSDATFTLRSRRAFSFAHLDAEERFRPSSLLTELGAASGMSVVVEGRDKPFGILGAYTRRPRHFTNEEVNFLQAVAHILAAAVDRRDAEQAQQELSIQLGLQGQRMDDILKNIPAVVWELRLDPETGQLRQAYTSDFVSTMIGFTKEECMDRPDLWQERLHPADEDRVVEAMHSALNGSVPGSTQFRWIARDGHPVWVESTVRPFYDAAGNIAGARGVALDIRERKTEEAKREEVEERFHDMLKNLPAVVWEAEVDPGSGKVCPIFVSDYIETLLGYPKEEWTKSRDFWLERIHPDDCEIVKRRIEEVFANEELGAEQFRWIARDGRAVWIQSSKRVVRDAEGTPVGVRGVNLDITDRKRAEMEREIAEKRFQAFMDHSPVVALMKDEEGRFVYGNRLFQEWCERLGLDWFGSTDHDLFPEELAERYRRLDRQALEQRISTQTLEISYDKEGVPSYWNILRFPVGEPNGPPALGIVAIDVTERRRLERDILEISDREQRRLGQELHDGLCQHLLGVVLMAKTLGDRMEKKNMPEASDVQTISGFLSEALALARGLMRGFHLVNIGENGLNVALSEFANTTAKLFGKPCEFISNTRVEIKEAEVVTHLFRIAQEATHNAIKHGEPNTVTISLDREDDHLILAVASDGRSFPEDLSSGPGMGVRSMKYRAELVGASLEFMNRPGGGTVVICRIPAGPAVKFV